MVMNFITDHKDQAGADFHTAFQVFTPYGGLGDVPHAAHMVFEALETNNFIPQAIWYIPGDYTLSALMALAPTGPLPPGGMPVYLSAQVVAEMQNQRTQGQKT